MKKLLCMFLMLSLLLTMAACAKTEESVNDAITGYVPADSGIGFASNNHYTPDTKGTLDDSLTEDSTSPVTEVTTYVAATTTAAATWAADVYAEAEWAAEAAAKAAAEAGEAAASVAGKKADATMAVPAVTERPKEPEIQIGAGMLTAGEWKDLENIAFWQNVLNNNDWYALMEQRSLFANKIVSVKVVDSNGNSCFNVPVSLTDENGKVIYKAVSDIDGMAYLLYDLDNKKQNAGQILVGDAKYDISEHGQTTVNLSAAGGSATQLDLMFMIDTTGSMGDELSYLQAELRDVIRRVSESGKVYAINLSVNFYRDSGDQYVVRSFEFTSDIEKAIDQLNQQSPNGGGDYAEAVHLALEDIVKNHQWRDDSVKLCFMVLDAPPHTEREIAGIDERMQNTVMTMAEQGIRLIPLASSGVNTETEFLLRSWAVMTGGTYTFLTNHSGIGNSHLEPTIGEYEVEKLNDLLVRVICEYCGIK